VVLASLSSSVTTFIRDHGLAAVFFLMLVDAVLPAASELVMVVGGALAAGAFGASVSLFGTHIPHGFWSYVAVALAGTIGYLLGSILGWAIGLYGGRPLLERHGRWFHLSPGNLERAERWFDKYEDWAVFVGRITPVVRSFVSIPAGVFRVNLGRYTVLTLAGSALWCFALAGVGWAAGTGYERFHRDFRWVEYAVVAGILAAAAYLIVRRRRSTTMPR
jgi:membrane protein DedA with SNARE-associated domain